MRLSLMPRFMLMGEYGGNGISDVNSSHLQEFEEYGETWKGIHGHFGISNITERYIYSPQCHCLKNSTTVCINLEHWQRLMLVVVTICSGYHVGHLWMLCKNAQVVTRTGVEMVS